MPPDPSAGPAERAVDVDRLLRRRLALQRYVTSLYADVRAALEDGDRALVAALAVFVADADEGALAALARQRAAHPDAGRLLAAMREVLEEQRRAVEALLGDALAALVEREGRVTSEAIGEREPPSMRAVASLPVAGALLGATLGAAFGAYGRRLLADVSGSATRAPDALVRIVRGTRAERYRDGVLGWRDERVLRPTVDVLVNGTAGNAATRVYEHFGIAEVDYVATLDFRVCPECAAAEAGSPYALGQAPHTGRHPFCRCIHLPRTQAPKLPDRARRARPFVLDARPVGDIPRSERAGKIGQTRQPIAALFDRMTRAERRAYMGASRAALWEAGKIDDVRDLVNSRTLRPLRLDELPAL